MCWSVRRAGASSRCPAWCPTMCSFAISRTGAFQRPTASAARTRSITCRSLTSSTTSTAMCRCCSIRSSPITCRPTVRAGSKALKLDALPFGAPLLVHGRVRTHTHARGLAHLRLRHRLIERRIDLRLESESPKRLHFDLMRIMRTAYRIDDFQDIYFVIDSYEQLFEATRPDFTPYYQTLRGLPQIGSGRGAGERPRDRTRHRRRLGPAAGWTRSGRPLLSPSPPERQQLGEGVSVSAFRQSP